MRFESQTFWLAKDTESPEQYQDAFGLDTEKGLAAIADGVTSGIFSGPWARLLAQATVCRPPNISDSVEFQHWLTELRARWLADIDLSQLTWYQRPKMVDGGMTTLLWVELTPLMSAEDESADSDDSSGAGSAAEIEPEELESLDAKAGYQLRAYSVGDCSFFHVRDGQVIRMFPFDNSQAFGLNPAVIGSIDRQTDHLIELQEIESECLPGDLIVLCTDALALWAIQRHETGETVQWDRYWDMPAVTWQEEMFALRRENLMRYDDTTLVLLRVIKERPAPVVLPSEKEPPDEREPSDEEAEFVSEGGPVTNDAESLLNDSSLPAPDTSGVETAPPASRASAIETPKPLVDEI